MDRIYRDYIVKNANFANSNSPWFKRGGNYNNDSNAGFANFNNNSSTRNNNNSFRAILTDYDNIFSVNDN